MRFLRTRILAGTMIATALVLIAAGFAIYVPVKDSLVSELDNTLQATLQTLQAGTEQRGDRAVGIESEATDLPGFSRKKRPDYFEAWLADGSVLRKSVSLGAADLENGSKLNPPKPAHFVKLPDGRRGRQVAITFAARREDKPDGEVNATMVTIAVARHTFELDEQLEQLRWLLVGVISAAVFAAGATIYIAVTRGLRPLGVLAHRISEIDPAASTTERVDLKDAPGEMTVVVDRLNGLLGRLGHAIERERGFTADVAHELRTPLAGLEATLEITASKVRLPEDYAARIAKCLGITRTLHAMVDNMLMLARADAGQLRVNRHPVELRAFVEDRWAVYVDRAAKRELSFSLDVPGELTISTDPDQLGIVINNLLDNAVTYADRGGAIRCSAKSDSSGVQIRIENTGCTLSAAQAANVFDRFWRGDDSRTDTAVHCGLGLSLCRKMTELLGGTISAACVEGSFVVELQFRLASSNTPGVSSTTTMSGGGVGSFRTEVAINPQS